MIAGYPYVLFVLCIFVILVALHYDFKADILVLMAPAPGHCLPF